MSDMRRRPIELADSPEHRAIPIESFDIEDSSEDTLVIKGYASTFQPYEMYGGPSNGYGWIEQIARGAFERTLKENPDLHLLINHEGLPLARTKSGNLDLSVDDGGLHVVARLDRSDPDVQRLEPKMRKRADGRPLMDEMSFAFRVKGQSWESTPEFKDDPEALRTITEVSLHKGDVSVVNWGANPTTSVSIDRALAALADCDPRELVEARSDNEVLLRAKAKLANVGILDARAADESLPAAENGTIRTDADLTSLPTGTVIDGLIETEDLAEAEARADADDSPASLIAALDAVLDEAIKLTADVDHETIAENVAQALDLLNGADALVDKLMEVSGIYDPDDDDADRANDDESEKREDAEDSEERTGITIPVTAQLTDEASGIFAAFQNRVDALEAVIRTLTGSPVEEAAPEPEERADEESHDSEEECDEAPQGISLRDALAEQGLSTLSLAEALAASE